MVFMVSMMPYPALAATQEYSLFIDKETVDITGKPLERVTINGAIPRTHAGIYRGG